MEEIIYDPSDESQDVYKFRFSGLSHFNDKEDWVFYVNYGKGVVYYYASTKNLDGKEVTYYINGEFYSSKENLYIEEN